MFVLGADSDTPSSVRDTVTFAIKNHIDTVMLNILTPLPGTQQFNDLDAQGRIITKDWFLYDAQHVVFEPRQMSAAELQREVLRAQRRFFHAERPVAKFASWAVTRKQRSYDRMLEYGWCWWYARMWWREPRNRRHMRMLEQRRRSQPPGVLEGAQRA